MKALKAFAVQFGAQLRIDPELLVENKQRYYLLNPSMAKMAKEDFYYAGLLLGKNKNGIFQPSFSLLSMIVGDAKNTVVLRRRAAWLFICGRDIFKGGISRFNGSKRKGDLTLVVNEFGECLGYGRIVGTMGEREETVVIKNVLDLGDFLRREKQQKD
jgi:ribosome biogenesis protein Nip4